MWPVPMLPWASSIVDHPIHLLLLTEPEGRSRSFSTFGSWHLWSLLAISPPGGKQSVGCKSNFLGVWPGLNGKAGGAGGTPPPNPRGGGVPIPTTRVWPNKIEKDESQCNWFHRTGAHLAHLPLLFFINVQARLLWAEMKSLLERMVKIQSKWHEWETRACCTIKQKNVSVTWHKGSVLDLSLPGSCPLHMHLDLECLRTFDPGKNGKSVTNNRCGFPVDSCKTHNWNWVTETLKIWHHIILNAKKKIKKIDSIINILLIDFVTNFFQPDDEYQFRQLWHLEFLKSILAFVVSLEHTFQTTYCNDSQEHLPKTNKNLTSAKRGSKKIGFWIMKKSCATLELL